jgi:hypothetical protein
MNEMEIKSIKIINNKYINKEVFNELLANVS